MAGDPSPRGRRGARPGRPRRAVGTVVRGGHRGGRGDGPLSGRGVEVDAPHRPAARRGGRGPRLCGAATPLQVWAATLVAAVAVLVHAGEPLAGTVLLVRRPLHRRHALPGPHDDRRDPRHRGGVRRRHGRRRAGLQRPGPLAARVHRRTAAAVGVAVRSQRAAVEAAEARAPGGPRPTAKWRRRGGSSTSGCGSPATSTTSLGHRGPLVNCRRGSQAAVLDSPSPTRRAPRSSRRAASRLGSRAVRATIGAAPPAGARERPTEPPRADRLPDAARRRSPGRAHGRAWSTATPSAVPATVDLTAYRIMQEALTNVQQARPHRTPSCLDDRLRGRHWRSAGDCPPTVAAVRDAAGTACVGMRERVAALSGRFAAGPSGGRLHGCGRAAPGGRQVTMGAARRRPGAGAGRVPGAGRGSTTTRVVGEAGDRLEAVRCRAASAPTSC